jgi:2-keto-4-pentenoate hydratase/2-oxohepta-3-ene-1,7-dioic acid hydratase in catechol pathway
LSKKWLPKSTWANGWERVPFALKKNGEVVQSATAESMLFHVHELISHVSLYMTLKMGDILFTGTPAGVGSVADGDVLEGFLDDQPMFRVQVHG